MRLKINIILILLLVALSAHSQQWEVVKFEENAQDLSAKKFDRTASGIPCALIKLSIPTDNVVFKSEDMVGIPERKDGYWWIYLLEEARGLRVIVNNNIPLEISFKDYDFIIEGRHTYKLQIDKQLQIDIENKGRKIADNSRRKNNNFAKNFFVPYYSFGVECGMCSFGGNVEMFFDIKFLSIGVGLYGSFSPSSCFPINNSPEFVERMYEFTTPAFYLYNALNFKYFGIGIKEVFYPIDSSKYHGGEEDEYIMQNYGKKIVGFVPCIKLHFPLNKWKSFWTNTDHDVTMGISATLGYSFVPPLSYNPGFECSVGFVLFR